MRVLVFAILAGIVLALSLAAASLSDTMAGARLRAFTVCLGQTAGEHRPITEASSAERRCLLATAELAARHSGDRTELELRATLWDRSTPPPKSLLQAASRLSKSEALLALNWLGEASALSFHFGYGCLAPHPEAVMLIDRAHPDPRSAICERLNERNPPRLRVQAVSAVIPWTGVCPTDFTELNEQAHLLPAAYAPLSGSAPAAGCMAEWSARTELDPGSARTRFWAGLAARLNGEAVAAAPDTDGLGALSDRVLEQEIISTEDSARLERFLIW